MDVESFLKHCGLGRFAEAFDENGVDAALLPELTNEDLKDLGVARLADRKKILAAIAAMDEQANADASAASVSLLEASQPEATAERRQLTLMFVDLVGSTALSGQLDPEEMREVIRGYQNTVAGEIARFEGHVAKFMGDGVLVYFGYPKAHEDAAERAVRAGLAVRDAVGLLAEPTGRSLGARIGIATGLVVVGTVGGRGK